MEGLQNRSETMKRQFAIELDAKGRAEAYPYSAMQLLQGTDALSIMEEQANKLGTQNMAVAGTLFAKRYSVLAMGAAASFTLYDVGIDLSYDKIGFRFAKGGALQYAAETFAPPAGSRKMDDATRFHAFSAYLREIENHVLVMFRSVSDCTGANLKVMSSLVSHNLHQLYATLEAGLEGFVPERSRQVRADASLLKEQRSSLSSLRYRSFPHAKSEASPLLIRRHCCLAYRLDTECEDGGDLNPSESHGYCLTCPKLDDDKRSARLSGHKH